jgi:ADP-ribose pyrophosphatase
MRKINFGQAKVAYANPFLEIRHTHAAFEGFTKDYYVVHFGPRVGVVAVREGKILLARQYRFLVQEMSWEIPGGKVEPGESPEVAGARECLEETGVLCRDLRPLVVYYPGLDNVDNRTTLLFSDTVEQPGEFVPNAAEVEEIAWVPFQQCLEMVFDQRILDALTVTGILAFQARLSTANL